MGRIEFYCQCEGWQKSSHQIDSAQLLAGVHGQRYTGDQFIFCPWCGSKLKTIQIPPLPRKNREFIAYRHHHPLVDVFVREDLKGKHRDYCLCYSCDLFKPEDREENCVIANMVYSICVLDHLVLPVWECADFREK